MNQNDQGQLNFGNSASEEGWKSWVEQRQDALHELARRLHLPLNHKVEVRFLDGVVVQGDLRLKEEVLFPDLVTEENLELRIGRMTFRYKEIEACVRLD